MTHLSISGLQSLQCTLDGERITNFRSTRAQALLIYLAVEADRPHQREVLAGLLWPDEPEAVARHNLGQTLLNLRTAIGDRSADPPFLLITRQTIQFNTASNYDLDIARLSAILAACRHHDHADLARCDECADHLQQIVDLYRGPFLAEFALSGSDLFDEWALLKREWLQREVLAALDQLAAYYLWRARYPQAEQIARRMITLDPLDEAAHRRLMHALAAGGQRGAALAHYAACRQTLYEQLGVAPSAATTALYEQIRVENGAGPAPSAAGAQSLHNGRPARQTTPVHDWAQAPDPHEFYGRTSELATIEQWLVGERCRLVAVLGMGGIGKTTLAARAARDLAPHFERIVWRSLLNAPPLTDLLAGCLRSFSREPAVEIPPGLDAQIELLLDCMRNQRCLLILDNAESLFEPSGRSGRYREGYAGYGQLFQAAGATTHQSCLLLTSREKPREWTRLADERGPVRVLTLAGLDVATGWDLLKTRCLECRPEIVQAIVERYSGNPLALQLVADTIDELYGGDMSAFLREETLIFDDIRDVLDQHFARLTPLEQAILYWLMIVREPCSDEELHALLIRSPSRSRELEALRSLQQHSLLEKRAGGFTLQNVLMEYLAERFVAQICQEIEHTAPELLVSHALLLAGAPEYVRQAQTRLLLAPVAAYLTAHYGRARLAVLLPRMLDRLRTTAPLAAGYAGGNILNLALQLELDLSGFDFTRLAVHQAYLRGATLPNVNLRETDLSGSVFTDTFSFVTAMTFSPAGAYLAAASGDANIRLWDVAGGQLAATLTGHDDFVWQMAFSPDGALLASASWDKTVGIWDTHNGRLLQRLAGHSGRVRAVAFSPDNMTVASGGEDCAVWLWNAQDGRSCATFQGHTAPVRAVGFCHKGKMLASGGEDGRIIIWNTHTGEMRGSLPGHRGGVWSLAYSPDNKILVSAGEDRTIRLWSTADGQLRGTLGSHGGAVWSVAYSPDGITIASGSEDRTVRIFTVADCTLRHTLPGHTEGVWAVAYSPDGTALASGGEDQTVRVWDVQTGLARHTLRGYTNWVYTLACAPGGATVASGTWDGMVRLWNAAGGQVLAVLSGHSQRVRALAYSPDGSLLVSGGEDHAICVWEMPRGRLHQTLHGHSGWVRALQFSSDGATLFSASMDGSIRLWDVHAARVQRILTGHAGAVTSLACLPDGTQLLSGGEDQTIRLWDLQSGAVLQTFAGHTQAINALAVTPDGAVLASAGADQTVRLWDLQSGALLHTLSGHTNWIWSLAICPDGALLASASADQTIRLWDVRSGGLRGVLTGHSNWVRSVVFAADGTLVSGGVDEQVKLWDVAAAVCRATWRVAGPYSGTNITGATGLSPAQRAALRALGAVEDPPA